MKTGVCASLASAPWLQECGFDFIELNVGACVEPEKPFAEVMPPLQEALDHLTVRPECWNCFLPADLKVVGPGQNLERQEAWVKNALERIALLGGQIVVFGSGKARQVPPGYAEESAREDLVRFLGMVGREAKARGIVVAIEPLNHTECNLINSVREGVELAQRVNHPAVQLLSDLYHVAHDRQSHAETTAAGPLLAHVHVATGGRQPPASGDEDFLRPFFAALKAGGYDGRISVEARWTDFDAQAAATLMVLRRAWDEASPA